VAGEALGAEERPNAFFEELQALRIRLELRRVGSGRGAGDHITA
jgi:hypothetical protein